jgi:hypothetical protein
MPNDWTFRAQAHFADSRPVLDVKYDIETRVRSLLDREPEPSGALVFRGSIRSYDSSAETVVELRLEAAYETHNLYALRLDANGESDPAKEKMWEENLRRAFDRWVNGLALTDALIPFSPDYYRQVVKDTIARELELKNRVNTDDDEAIRVIQETILSGLRGGGRFSTAHHEGGTNIRFHGMVFVIQDYGESNDREEFGSDAEFLASLRKFYDWESRRDWYPHVPPEIEAWRYIERQMRASSGSPVP